MYFHTALLFTSLTKDHDDITFEQLLWNVGFFGFAFQRSIYRALYSWGGNFKKQITLFRF